MKWENLFKETVLNENVFVNFGVGCVFNNQICDSDLPFLDHTNTFTTKSIASNQNKAHKGDILITTTSSSKSDICKAIAWLGEEEVIVSNDVHIFQHSLNPKYVAYFFKTPQLQNQKKLLVTGTMKRLY